MIPATLKAKSNTLIRWLLVGGLLTLPYTHLRWLPNLGTTRPLSALPLALAAGLITLSNIPWSEFALRDPKKWGILLRPFQALPGWAFLRWWLALIALGALSALITPFYGSFFQALNRLFGYTVIFVFLFCGLYAGQHLGLEKVSKWVGLGYLPVLGYAFIEAAATRGAPWAGKIVLFMRQWVIVDYRWLNRMSLFATEPSFIGFQVLLLIALFPFLKSRLLRLSTLALFGLIFVFTSSGMVLALVSIYLLALLVQSLPRRWLVWGILTLEILALLGVMVYALSPAMQAAGQELVGAMLANERIYNFFASSAIRSSYTRNLIYTLIETRGLGLGIGQYGMFWKEIYLRHVDYHAIDVRGEITQTLNSSEYMRPWSVVLGIGVDLGLVGLAIFLYFYYLILRACESRHGRAIATASFFALMGAYPIVTPHIWLGLALLANAGQQATLKATPPLEGKSA